MWHEEGVDARTTREHPTRRSSDRAGQLPEDEIRALKYRVARLEWEMAALRQSATFFGDLAERLNTQLRTSRQRES
jgi:hypothetical protein